MGAGRNACGSAGTAVFSGTAVSILSLAEATADANAIWAGRVEWVVFSVGSIFAAKAIPDEVCTGSLADITAGAAGSGTCGALCGTGGFTAMSESSGSEASPVCDTGGVAVGAEAISAGAETTGVTVDAAAFGRPAAAARSMSDAIGLGMLETRPVSAGALVVAVTAGGAGAGGRGALCRSPAWGTGGVAMGAESISAGAETTGVAVGAATFGLAAAAARSMSAAIGLGKLETRAVSAGALVVAVTAGGAGAGSCGALCGSPAWDTGGVAMGAESIAAGAEPTGAATGLAATDGFRAGLALGAGRFAPRAAGRTVFAASATGLDTLETGAVAGGCCFGAGAGAEVTGVVFSIAGCAGASAGWRVAFVRLWPALAGVPGVSRNPTSSLASRASF